MIINVVVCFAPIVILLTRDANGVKLLLPLGSDHGGGGVLSDAIFGPPLIPIYTTQLGCLGNCYRNRSVYAILCCTMHYCGI
jgi:hypothetical protein